jgi:hypothetical protein
MPTTITSAGVTFNDTTSLTSANIGTAQLVNGSVIAAKLGTTEQKQICKAWVNFDGTLSTPITPRASYNVSSVTKNGTGDYTVNFATPMADANYSISSSVGGTANREASRTGDETTPRTTALFRIYTFNSSTGAVLDVSYANCQVFGN